MPWSSPLLRGALLRRIHLDLALLEQGVLRLTARTVNLLPLVDPVLPTELFAARVPCISYFG